MTIAIIGGGPAGAAAATLLARAGRDVLLLERSPGPADKVCGDFLSGEAAESVRSLGVDLAALAPEPLHRVRLVAGGRIAETNLPFHAWGLTRRTLDEALLRAAEAAGAQVRRGAAVRSLAVDANGAAQISVGDETLHASDALLATGKHDLRGWPRPPRRGNDLIGLKSYFQIAPDQACALAGHIEIILFDGGYAGLQPVEGGRANLCLLVSRDAYARAGGDWHSFLTKLSATSPHLARRLDGAIADREKPLAISAIPYGHVQRPGTDDIFRLGDQAGVIPSLTGDGVAIALHSARIAAETLLADGDAHAHHRRLSADLSSQIGLAMLMHRLARRNALQSAIVAACRTVPSAMRMLARFTRVRGFAS